MKNITITGPRSVGKSTVSKLLAKELKKKYISSDEIGEKALKKQGGLDAAIKSGAIKEMIRNKGYSLIKNIYAKEKNFVYDLSIGAFTSKDFPEASAELRNLANKKTILIGLLPCRNNLRAILFLFNRERKREHFRESKKLWLLRKTARNYKRAKRIFEKEMENIIYTWSKSSEEIVKEIKLSLAS